MRGQVSGELESAKEDEWKFSISFVISTPRRMKRTLSKSGSGLVTPVSAC